MSKRARHYPEWMTNRKEAVGDALSNIEKARTLKDKNEEPMKRPLRSNFKFPKTAEEEIATKSRFNTDDLPMVSYDGKIHYLSDYFAIAEALDKLIKIVDLKESDDKVGVAFDMEWTFSFKSGPEKTSLIQLCVDLEDCYLFHLTLLNKIPAGLSIFLNHPRVILHGVNIKNDLRKLERDFSVIKADPLIQKCLDLGVWYNEIFNSSGRWSMERLVLQTLRLRVDKSRQIRMSKWHIHPLSENQQKYAAIDVYVSTKI
jgi:werner syndrome-like exonuclease